MKYLLIGCGNEHSKRIWFDANGENGKGSPERDFGSGELVTLDIDPDLSPSVVHDLDKLPYPFADDEFDEIHAYEVLEHCGRQGDGEFFFAQFREFYRILKHDGYLMISVPMWDNEIAWGVPDHKRVLPKSIFAFLDRAYYENIGKAAYGDYRHLLGDVHLPSVGFEESETQLHVVLRAVKHGDER